MERYEFKVKRQEKCIKIFLSSAEVESLNVYSLYEKIRIMIHPRINGKEVNMRYLDNSGDWVDLPSDDLDSFIRHG